jgi:hypothetical protein
VPAGQAKLKSEYHQRIYAFKIKNNKRGEKNLGFVYSFIKYSLNTCPVLGTVLEACDTSRK